MKPSIFDASFSSTLGFFWLCFGLGLVACGDMTGLFFVVPGALFLLWGEWRAL